MFPIFPSLTVLVYVRNLISFFVTHTLVPFTIRQTCIVHCSSLAIMVEPFSIGTGVVTVLNSAVAICNALYEFWMKARSRSSDIPRFKENIDHLEKCRDLLIRRLQKVEQSGFDVAEVKDYIDRLGEQCEEQADRLREMLQKYEKGGFIVSVKYGFKKDPICEALSILTTLLGRLDRADNFLTQ